jgi:hypothetical protein
VCTLKAIFANKVRSGRVDSFYMHLFGSSRRICRDSGGNIHLVLDYREANANLLSLYGLAQFKMFTVLTSRDSFSSR